MTVRVKLLPSRETAGAKSPGLAYDCDIAVRIKQGDRAALQQMVERHSGRVRSYLARRLGSGHDEKIDRVVAATFAQAVRKIGPYASGSASTPMELWLIRIAEYKLARLWTKEEKRKANGDTPTGDLERLRAALAEVPNRHSFVLALALFEQMPTGSIAHTLGASPAGAMRRLRAALRRVQQALDRQEEAS